VEKHHVFSTQYQYVYHIVNSVENAKVSFSLKSFYIEKKEKKHKKKVLK
jgi:hypothetical protein